MHANDNCTIDEIMENCRRMMRDSIKAQEDQIRILNEIISETAAQTEVIKQLVWVERV